MTSDSCLIDRNAFTSVIERSQAHHILRRRVCIYELYFTNKVAINLTENNI